MSYLWVETVKDAVGLLLQDGHSHGEVMVLHGGGGVDLRQRRLDINHELVVISAMVKIMTDGAHPLTQTLTTKYFW